MDPDQTINQPLRAAVEHAVAGGESLYSIAGGAGMDYAMLRRFRNGEHANLRSDHAGRLAQYLGLELRKVEGNKP